MTFSESIQSSLTDAKGLADAVYAALRPPPSAPDGYYDSQVDPDAVSARDTDLTAKLFTSLHPFTSSTPKPQLGAKAIAVVDKLVHWQAENDRLGAFEDTLSLMSLAPPNSKIGKALADKAIGVLYNGVPHPPSQYLGPKFDFRQHDGSFNNIHQPEIGKAGAPYSRTVQPKKSIHPSTLPDPGLLFDTLLRARDRVDHKGGNSALTFAFATLVTHSLFNTNFPDMWVNNASSYLDLSPLYGNNADDVAKVRDLRPSTLGRGFLLPDTFSDGDLNFLPPAASALLVLFNRNHNYIAEHLLKLNEKNAWFDPLPTDQDTRKKQDDDIFETARLVNCGHFISMIMNDYVAGFLGLSEGNAWNMNAFDPIKFRSGETVERGQGNHASVEFNLLYRWHTTISEPDEKFAINVFENVAEFKKKGLSNETMDVRTFTTGLLGDVNKHRTTLPHERTFGNLVRGKDGRFSDDDLTRILMDATEAPAGQYRARGTPGVLRPVEMLAIVQARKWGVCTMNEFRSFLGLKQFDDFEEWNPDPEIAEAARHLYGHIDNLELYPGLQAEQHMALSAGLRFSCGYTMTRAVLSDAIALVRGDRFYTTSYSPVHLTSWGFQDATARTENGGFGGHLPKLLMRHFPRHYPYNNVYGIFPFFTPKKMGESLKRQGIDSKYTFARPPPPGSIPKFINNFEQINFVFNNPEKFTSGYFMKGLGNGHGFMIAIDERTQHDKEKAQAKAATFESNELYIGYVQWFRNTLIKELKEQSWKAGDDRFYVDIVNVVKTVHVYWAADMLCGVSLKTKENPRGRFTVKEVFDMFADLFTASFVGLGDTENFWMLVENAKKASEAIQGATRESVKRVKASYTSSKDVKEDKTAKYVDTLKGWVREVEDYVWPPEEKPWFEFISRLDAGRTRTEDDLVANIVGLADGSSVNQAHSAINVIDFYLQDSKKAHYAKILDLIRRNDEDSDKLLKGYVREAMRLNPQFTGLWRVAQVDTNIPGTKPPISIKKNERVWGGFKLAHLNEKDFPKPLEVDPTRDPSKYQLNGGGFHLCIGVDFAVQVITDIIKIVYSRKNLQRAAGPTGHLAITTKKFNAVDTNQYIKSDGSLTDWPQSLLLSYEA